MKKISILNIAAAAAFCLNIACASAQTEVPATKPESETKPLELPNFIIEGKEQLSVQSGGIKQFPDKQFQLTKNELDSLNSLEKQPSLLLPPKPLPERTTRSIIRKGFITGEFGRFITPSIEGGYDFNIGGYDIYANGGFELSQGHVDKAGYSKGFLTLFSDYIAPDKYLIFGGSKTRFSANFHGNGYELYAIPAAPSRNTIDGSLTIGSEGNFEGYKFNTGAGLNTLQLSQDNAKAFDNAVNAYLYLSGYWDTYEVGLGAQLDLHSVRGDGASFIQADANMKYRLDDFSINADAGIQTVNNTGKIARMGLLLKADGEYRLSHLITIRAMLFSGYENNSFRQMMEFNPYLNPNAAVDFSYKTNVKGYLLFHPSVDLSLSAGGGFGMTIRNPIFFTADTATFLVNYLDSKELYLTGEANWQPTNEDNINAGIYINYSSLDSNGNITPYSVPLKAGVNYRRTWLDNFGTQIGFYYLSKRFADIDNKKELPGHIDLNLRADYSFNNDLTVYAKFENLLNSNVYFWEGYKERSLFVSAGILWKF